MLFVSGNMFYFLSNTEDSQHNASLPAARWPRFLVVLERLSLGCLSQEAFYPPSCSQKCMCELLDGDVGHKIIVCSDN